VEKKKNEELREKREFETGGEKMEWKVQQQGVARAHHLGVAVGVWLYRSAVDFEISVVEMGGD